jgi:hypothetical protein
VQDPTNLHAERSLLNQHVKHRLVASYLYDLPFGRGRAFGSNVNKIADVFLGGWTVGGIMSILSGFPVNPVVQGNPSNVDPSFNMDRPDVVGEWKLPHDERDPTRWWNTAALVPNQRFQYGNAGRNILEAPGTFKWDMAIHKNFNPNERIRIQFRAESFNAFNHPIFDRPNPTVGNRNFGIVTGAAPGRIMQMGLKVIF